MLSRTTLNSFTILTLFDHFFSTPRIPIQFVFTYIENLKMLEAGLVVQLMPFLVEGHVKRDTLLIPILTFVDVSVRFSGFVFFINLSFCMHLMKAIVEGRMIRLGAFAPSSRIKRGRELMFINSARDKSLTSFYLFTPNSHLICIVSEFLHELRPLPLTKTLFQMYFFRINFDQSHTLRHEFHMLMNS